MRHCKKCNLEILNRTAICPLCKSVLEVSGEVENGTEYPDVAKITKKLNFVVRLYSFLAIVIEAVLIIINYKVYHGLWWSAISGISILYFYITLKYSIQKNTGYKAVILTQIIGAVLLVVAVDNIVGYRGWSVNYVMPGAILLLDATIVVLMIVNMANWQSYILMQILTVLVSAVGMVLWGFDVVTKPLLLFFAAGASGSLLLATLIFGERRAKMELKRRFHV